MRSEALRNARLARLSRVRTVEQKQALDRLGQALSAQQHAIELADQTLRLAQSYASEGGNLCAGTLNAELHFRGQLLELHRSTQSMTQETKRDVAEASLQYTKASRKREIIDGRVAEARRHQNPENTLKPQQLAHNLLSRSSNLRRNQR